jgi:hypothetical protein
VSPGSTAARRSEEEVQLLSGRRAHHPPHASEEVKTDYESVEDVDLELGRSIGIRRGHRYSRLPNDPER